MNNKPEKKELKVECTWGEGPDIIVSLSGKKLLLLEDPIDKNRWTYGLVSKGQIDLTCDEAQSLIAHLQRAIYQVDDLNSMADYYSDEHPVDDF